MSIVLATFCRGVVDGPAIAPTLSLGSIVFGDICEDTEFPLR